MTLKNLNSPYLFKTKLRFFGCPIRTTGIFLPKNGNRELKASLSKKWLITNSSSPWQFCKYIYDSTAHASSETQGQSVGPGEKARRKFSSTGGKAPGYRLSPDHFQFLQSSFREFIHDCYYLATVARFVHQAFLTWNEGTTDKSKNVSDAINKSNSISSAKILFLTDHNVS